METRKPITLPHDGTALAKYIRVKWSGTALAACSGTERGIGTLADTVLSGDTKVTVIPWHPARKMVAAGAFAIGADIYGAASGKVDDTVTTNLVGIALEAASGDGSIVEVLPVAELEVPA